MFTHLLHNQLIPSTSRMSSSLGLSSKKAMNNSSCSWKWNGCARTFPLKYSNGTDSTLVLWRTHWQIPHLLDAERSVFSSSRLAIQALYPCRQPEWRLYWDVLRTLPHLWNLFLICVPLTQSRIKSAQGRLQSFWPFRWRELLESFSKRHQALKKRDYSRVWRTLENQDDNLKKSEHTGMKTQHHRNMFKATEAVEAQLSDVNCFEYFNYRGLNFFRIPCWLRRYAK